MYIGTPPQSGFISQEANQYFTGLTQNYIDLNQSISSLSSVIVLVNGVVQENSDLTLTSSTRITLGATLVSADKVTCIYVAKISSTQAPATGSVTSDMLSGSIANSKLSNSSITLNGSAVSLGGSATVGGDNTPYFQVYKSANQTISNATFTTVTFDTEQYDSGSAFSSNTFTAPSTGYYFIYSQLVYVGGTDSNYTLNRLMKNGSPINWVAFVQDSSNGAFGGRVVHLSASDTVIVQTYQQSGGNLDLNGGSEDECFFGGFKIIT